MQSHCTYVCAHCNSPFTPYRRGVRQVHCSQHCAIAARKNRLHPDFWSNAVVVGACWEWQHGRNKAGYGTLVVDRRHWLAHRYAWFLTHGIGPDNLKVLHQCDNPPCIRPEHLFLGTQLDNIRDRDAKRRTATDKHAGSRNGRAKLTDQDITTIRSRYAAGGVSQQALADEYGIHQTGISGIIRRQTWKDS